MIKVDIYDLSLGDLQALLAEMGEPKFRAKQLYRQLYVNWAESPEEMSDLSKALRSKLSEQVVFGAIELVRVFSGDEGMTRKAVWKLPGGETIETVLMVYKDRATVCVSSQAGCPMGCVFCATAKLGFMQDLTSGQMIAQVLWAAPTVGVIHSTTRRISSLPGWPCRWPSTQDCSTSAAKVRRCSGAWASPLLAC